MNKGIEIAVAKDIKTLRKMQNSLIDDPAPNTGKNYYFTGHVKYLNKWINIKTYQKLNENEFQTGVFVFSLDIIHIFSLMFFRFL